MLDNNNIHIRPRYRRSVANTWADKLNRHLDSDDWQLDPSVSYGMDTQFGPHTIERFASALNKLLPRYNANWLDPSCEAVDSLHLAHKCRKTIGEPPHRHYYPTLPKSYNKAAQQRHWLPPVGMEKRGTKHLPSWRATRRSRRPARTCSIPGGGTDEVQSASLTAPSLSSGFPSGLDITPPGRSKCYPDHVQHTTDQTSNPDLPHPSS
jgi:hypothetical protein